MRVEELVDYFSPVPSGVVREQAYPIPTFQQFSEKPDVRLLVFCVGELEDERFGASGAEDVDLLVTVVEFCSGARAFLSPTAHYAWE